jgi:hypothetical protein
VPVAPTDGGGAGGRSRANSCRVNVGASQVCDEQHDAAAQRVMNRLAV